MSQALRPYTIIQYDPKQTTPKYFVADFKSSNYKCPVQSIELYSYDRSKTMKLPRPCHPAYGCDRKVTYLQNKKQMYTFRLKATALGRAYYYSPTMKIDVCASDDMKSVAKANITRIFGLNSRSSTRYRDIQFIPYRAHYKLLYMEKCQLCSLRYYKFIDDKGKIDRNFIVDRYRNIVVRTMRPLRKKLRMVGYMPPSLH